MVSVDSLKFRVLGATFLLSVLFLGVITPAYAEQYVFVLKWGSYGSGDGEFNNPRGVAVDGSGNVYVTDFNNRRVQKFAPQTEGPVPEFPGAEISVVAATFAFFAAFYLSLRRRKQPHSTIKHDKCLLSS